MKNYFPWTASIAAFSASAAKLLQERMDHRDEHDRRDAQDHSQNANPSPCEHQAHEEPQGLSRQTALWSVSLIVFVLAITTHYHLPLMWRIVDFHNRMPPTPIMPGAARHLTNCSKAEDLIRIEKQVVEWHEKLWNFRNEIMATIALVDMDDEEDFELESLKSNDSKKNKSPWLTLHLFVHALLIVSAHVHGSWYLSMTAIYSQLVFLALFLRAKALGDAVSSGVSVVRKFGRNLGSVVSVSSPERTLLQYQVLQNKMQYMTDIHESHQLGIGFFFPFVGTLDVDLETLVSISCGFAFELILLIATRLHAYILQRRAHRMGIRREESIILQDICSIREQVNMLNKQVKERLEEIEILMLTTREQGSNGLLLMGGADQSARKKLHECIGGERFNKVTDARERVRVLQDHMELSCSTQPAGGPVEITEEGQVQGGGDMVGGIESRNSLDSLLQAAKVSEAKGQRRNSSDCTAQSSQGSSLSTKEAPGAAAGGSKNGKKKDHALQELLANSLARALDEAKSLREIPNQMMGIAHATGEKILYRKSKEGSGNSSSRQAAAGKKGTEVKVEQSKEVVVEEEGKGWVTGAQDDQGLRVEGERMNGIERERSMRTNAGENLDDSQRQQTSQVVGLEWFGLQGAQEKQEEAATLSGAQQAPLNTLDMMVANTTLDISKIMVEQGAAAAAAAAAAAGVEAVAAGTGGKSSSPHMNGGDRDTQLHWMAANGKENDPFEDCMEVNDLESFNLSTSMLSSKVELMAAEEDNKTPPLIPLSPPLPAASTRHTGNAAGGWRFVDLSTTPSLTPVVQHSSPPPSASPVAPLISLGIEESANGGGGGAAAAAAAAAASPPPPASPAAAASPPPAATTTRVGAQDLLLNTEDHLSSLQQVQPLVDRSEMIFEEDSGQSLNLSSNGHGGDWHSTSNSPPQDKFSKAASSSPSSPHPIGDLPRNNDPGYPGNLTEEQRQACSSLLSFMEVELKGETGREQGKILLTRMGGMEEVSCKLLRANGWKVDRAKVMFTDILDYRSSHKLHELIKSVIGSQLVLDPNDPAWRPAISDAGVRKVLGFVPCRRIGFTLTGQLVEYWAIANLFPADLQKHCIHDEILRWWHFHLESGLLGSLLGARHFNSALRGSVVIFDLLGLSSRHMNTHVLRLLHQLFEIGQKKYPESLSKVFVLNSPSLFYGIWRIIKPVLNERTRNKIVICSKAMHDDLVGMLPQEVMEHMEACKKDKMQEFSDPPPPPARSGPEDMGGPSSFTGAVKANGTEGKEEEDVCSAQSLPVDLHGGPKAKVEGEERSAHSCTEIEPAVSPAAAPVMLTASSPSLRGSNLLQALTSQVSPIVAEDMNSASKLPADNDASFLHQGVRRAEKGLGSPPVQLDFDSSSIAKMFEELDESATRQ